MKKGLILEGGAMRGMYTAGVLDIIMENDITVDGAIGVSAGAAFGCNLKSKQIGRTIRYNTKSFCVPFSLGCIKQFHPFFLYIRIKWVYICWASFFN